MTNRARLVVSAACLVFLGSCGVIQHKEGTHGNPCAGATCTVTVTATDCRPDGSGITVVPDPVYIGKGSRDINWEIATPGYSFDRSKDGIQFKPGTPSGVFSEKLRKDDKNFKWKDDNAGGSQKKYGYNVNLTDPAGKACSKDPTIVNDV